MNSKLESRLINNFSNESSVGITEYIGSCKGFYGIIKQRYTDFQVNEINSSGEIISLTDLSMLALPEDKPIGPSALLTPSTISQKYIDDLKEFSSTGVKDKEIKINVESLTKEERSKIHEFIKFNFKNLDSTTKQCDDGGGRYISVSLKGLKPGRNLWPKMFSHVHFILFKQNLDTMEAINILANKLRLNVNRFTYAGTKDKRGITSQEISVFQILPERIATVAKCHRGISVGNFSFHNDCLRLGSHKGNHFRIALREVSGCNEDIENSLKSVGDNGFINYYGMQRFGTSSIPTHLIGKMLLLGNWEEAVKLILMPQCCSDSKLVTACEVWQNHRNAELALQHLKNTKGCSIEIQLLKGLQEYGKNDYVNALSRISKNMRSFYIHSYQSYIWNLLVSKRIKEFGLKVLEGDLVYDADYEINNEQIIVTENETRNASKSVHLLTSEEAKVAKIFEVLLPLPGHKVLYPNNIIKDWVKEFLQNDGFTSESFYHKVKEYSAKGDYRTIFSKPKNLKWSICNYDDYCKSIIQTDLDKLNGVSVDENRLDYGKYKSVILEFSLNPSSYATMLLRELMKMDTSSQFHSTLNTSLKSDSHRDSTKQEAMTPEKSCQQLKKIKTEER